MKMRNKLLMGGVVALSLGLCGCSAIALQPGAQKVLVSNSPAAQNCKFLGTVTANQGNFFTGAYTSNKNLQEGAFNDIRNQAVALGGNRVVLVMSTAASTASESRVSTAGSAGGMSMSNSMGGGGSSETNVALTGDVFACPNQ